MHFPSIICFELLLLVWIVFIDLTLFKCFFNSRF
jgi:hypothetical protein